MRCMYHDFPIRVCVMRLGSRSTAWRDDGTMGDSLEARDQVMDDLPKRVLFESTI